MKNRYLALMERAFLAYGDERIREYFDRVKKEGLTEHGFARLCANMGVLIANGRQTSYLPLLREMMDFCCREMPICIANNDFTIREIMTSIDALEETQTVSREQASAWRECFRHLVRERCYRRFATRPDEYVGNWGCFTTLSEFLRQRAGLVDARDFIELQLTSQMHRFDDNGMYRDPNEPLVYDFVTRSLFALLLHFGYDGAHREEIDDLLRRAGLLSLEMQSTLGEFPYGGRSNQFYHNEALLCAVFELEARRYAKEGDLALASRFRLAAKRALDSLEAGLGGERIFHIKNRYPVDSGFGCEGYAYFDKYMITAASTLYKAYLLADDAIPIAPDEPLPLAPRVTVTSDYFHKVFATVGDYHLEMDTNADTHYDSSGIGRLHRRGCPAPLCLSVPATVTPSYGITLAENKGLAIVPGILGEEGFRYALDLPLTLLSHGCEDGAAVIRFSAEPCGKRVLAEARLAPNGLTLTVTGEGRVACLLPAFLFDGEENTVLSSTDKTLSVKYRGAECLTETDGVLSDEGVCENRNGRYARFRAEGDGCVRVLIRLIPKEGDTP